MFQRIDEYLIKAIVREKKKSYDVEMDVSTNDGRNLAFTRMRMSAPLDHWSGTKYSNNRDKKTTFKRRNDSHYTYVDRNGHVTKTKFRIAL